MAKFIEVTGIGGNKELIFIDKILRVSEETDGTFIELGCNAGGDGVGVLAFESYAEIKQKISEV